MTANLLNKPDPAAAQADRATSAEGGKFLTFKLDNIECGVEILKVRETIQGVDITAVPQMPVYMKGVINLRGKVIPVVDLRLKFGLEEIEYTEQTCIIVVDVGQEIGIIVDTAPEALDVPRANIETPPLTGGTVDTSFILGIGKVGDTVKVLLDIDKVMTADELGDVVRAAEVHKDDTDVPEDGATVVPIIKDLEGQVDSAFSLKKVVEADLEATQKRLSEELAVRAESEARVESHEPQAALVGRLRENIASTEQERDKFANSLAQTQQQLEAVTEERDSLVEETASAKAQAKRLAGEKKILEAQVMNLADKAANSGRLRGELAEATGARRDSGEQVRDLASRPEASAASRTTCAADLAAGREAVRRKVAELRQRLRRADRKVPAPQRRIAEQNHSCRRNMPAGKPVASPAPSDAALIRTIRLEDSRVGAILDRLDAEGRHVGHSRRESGRCQYRTKHCVVHLQQLGASDSTPYVVATRNISAGGLSFLHGAYVHEGSQCLVQLITTGRAWQNVAGVVAHCRYTEAGLHEVGVRFDGAIGLGDFVCSPGYSRRETVTDR